MRASQVPRGKLSELRTSELELTELSASTVPGLAGVRQGEGVMSVVMLIEDSTLPGFIEVEIQTRYYQTFNTVV